MVFLKSFLVTLCLAFLLLMLGLLLGAKGWWDRELSSPFECGFSPKFSARLPFSIRFFMIAIVFLIFDVELVLLFPVVPAVVSSEMVVVNVVFTAVVVILLAGLTHEVFQGSLAWAQ